MKKKYTEPYIELFPIKCHIRGFSTQKPNTIDRSRRSLLLRTGLIATVGHISLYGGSTLDTGNGFGRGNGNGFGRGNGNGLGRGNGNGFGRVF